MNELMTTVHPIGRAWFMDQPVRIYGTLDEQLWLVEDIRPILGFIARAHVLLKNHPENEKLVHLVDAPGQAREMWFVNEAGLYRLIFHSRRPEAEKFKTWVCNDVLPTIRKYGRYPAENKGETQIPLRVPPELQEFVPDDPDFEHLPLRFKITVAERIKAVMQVATAPYYGLFARCKEVSAMFPDRKCFSAKSIWHFHQTWLKNGQSWRCLVPGYRVGPKEGAI